MSVYFLPLRTSLASAALCMHSLCCHKGLRKKVISLLYTIPNLYVRIGVRFAVPCVISLLNGKGFEQPDEKSVFCTLRKTHCLPFFHNFSRNISYMYLYGDTFVISLQVWLDCHCHSLLDKTTGNFQYFKHNCHCIVLSVPFS